MFSFPFLGGGREGEKPCWGLVYLFVCLFVFFGVPKKLLLLGRVLPTSLTLIISNEPPCVGIFLVLTLLVDIIASVIKERKQITKLFINLNLDDIVQLKFTDHVFVPMSTFTCCQKTTAF